MSDKTMLQGYQLAGVALDEAGRIMAASDRIVAARDSLAQWRRAVDTTARRLAKDMEPLVEHYRETARRLAKDLEPLAEHYEHYRECLRLRRQALAKARRRRWKRLPL